MSLEYCFEFEKLLWDKHLLNDLSFNLNKKIYLNSFSNNKVGVDIMSQWVEFALREDEFDFIIECLESKCEDCEDYFEIERGVYLIDDLHKQKRKYFDKLFSKSDIKL